MIGIGIICPSEIAFRRFLPALKQDRRFQFAGIGVANTREWYEEGINVDTKTEKTRLETEKVKAQAFIDTYKGGKVYNSYAELITADDIEAVYLPLPPALHFKWAKFALENGKHVFVEKPSTTDVKDTQTLITVARQNGIALHENYMFIYHDQLKAIDNIVSSGEIGEVRLYRITFGFPFRTQNDFRYNKALGGGALIDAGGYTLKYASYLLGSSARLVTANLNYLAEYDVDIYGSATLINNQGVTAQVAFGMDCDYKCEIEIWGSKGTITSDRILTAPAGYESEYILKKNQDYEKRKLPADDAFYKSIVKFYDCIKNASVREEEYKLIEREAQLLTDFKEMTVK